MNVNHQELHQNFNQKVKDNTQNGSSIPIVPQKKSTFISKVQRFHSSNTMTPGPGTYQSKDIAEFRGKVTFAKDSKLKH